MTADAQRARGANAIEMAIAGAAAVVLPPVGIALGIAFGIGARKDGRANHAWMLFAVAAAGFVILLLMLLFGFSLHL